jgi:hypothetical protein
MGWVIQDESRYHPPPQPIREADPRATDELMPPAGSHKT